MPGRGPSVIVVASLLCCLRCASCAASGTEVTGRSTQAASEANEREKVRVRLERVKLPGVLGTDVTMSPPPSSRLLRWLSKLKSTSYGNRSLSSLLVAGTAAGWEWLWSGSRSESLMEPLTNLANVQYLGSVQMGTPRQDVTVVFDTGSSDLWISETAFQWRLSETLLCPSPGDCNERVTIHYNVGTVQGPLLVDRLAIRNWSVSGQEFVLAETTTGLGNAYFQGVLGLAFSELSHSSGATVLSHLTGDAGIFSFLLARESEPSEFLLGPPPAASFEPGSLAYAPVPVRAWWTFKGAMAIGDILLCDDSIFALDTGTSYMSVPVSYIKSFLQTLLPNGTVLDQCTRQEQTHQFVCPCDGMRQAKVMYVLVGGQEYPVYPEDMFSRIGDSSSCVLEVQPSPDTMPFILGDTFLRTVAAIFDVGQHRVGVARRVDHRALLPSTLESLRKDGESRSRRGPLLPPHWITVNPPIPLPGMIVGAIVVGIGLGCSLGSLLARLRLLRPGYSQEGYQQLPSVSAQHGRP